jgi:glycosyltransferase involved in cell wall biosynthesis
MRILQVIPYFNKKYGGIYNICINESIFLSQNGYEVTILTTDYEIDMVAIQEILKNKVKIIVLQNLFNPYMFLYTPKLNKWANKNIMNYDLIHLHEFRSYQSIVISKYAKQKNIPYVIQPHGSLKINIGRKQLKKLFDFWYGNNIIRNANKIICITENEINDCLAFREKGEIALIPNGIFCGEFNNQLSKNDIRKKLKWGSNELYILYLGRIHPSKGLDKMIEAFSIISKNMPNVNLVIAGPDYNYLNKLLILCEKLNLNDKLIIYNFINDELKKQILASSDIFITPEYSGFPVTFLEAGVSGLPIITTNVGDRLLLFDHGVMVTENTSKELANGLKNLLGNQKLMGEMSQQIRSFTQSNYDWVIIGSLLEKCYFEIITNTKKHE